MNAKSDTVEVAFPKGPSAVLTRQVRGSRQGSSPRNELHLLFLGCESRPPYGPHQHTASLFLDLLSQAFERSMQNSMAACGVLEAEATTIALHVYQVSEGQFPPPRAYLECDGVILPGSFDAAYNPTDRPWIRELCDKIIPFEIVARNLPALGVCFGHQVYAHSLPGGRATKCPVGCRAGRMESPLSSDGIRWLTAMTTDTTTSSDTQPINDDENETATATTELYYTHGDMVSSLPPQGKILFGSPSVPIQAAAYLVPPAPSHLTNEGKVVAVTFQAHPEYAASRLEGLEGTLIPVLNKLEALGDLSPEQASKARADARVSFERVHEESLRQIVAAGRLLGWFPAALREVT